MGRIFAAPTNEQTRARDHPKRDEIDQLCRTTIETEWQWTRPALKKANRIKAKLADPALAKHSRRSEAEATFAQMEEAIDRAMRKIGWQWEVMSQQAIDELVSDGWPAAKSSVEFVVRLIGDIVLGEPYLYWINRTEDHHGQEAQAG
jgi:hypothetical protein